MMPRYLLKCEPGRDVYVLWSTVTDNAVMIGDRASLAEDPEVGDDPDRWRRTDETGTSRFDGEGRWGDDLLLGNVHGLDWRMLPRESLSAYIDLLGRSEASAEAISAITRPAEPPPPSEEG